MYGILPKRIGVSRIYYTLTEQHTVTQPRMEAANLTAEAIAKSEKEAHIGRLRLSVKHRSYQFLYNK